MGYTTFTAANLSIINSQYYPPFKFERTYAAVAANTSIFLAFVISANAKEKHADKITIIPNLNPLLSMR